MAQATLTARIKANVNGMAKSGATTLALVLECAEHMNKSGDGSKLCLLVSLLPSGDAKRIKAIASAACGVTFKASKKANEGMVAKRARGTEDELAAFDRLHVLAAYVDREVSFRSDALAEPIGNLPALLTPAEKPAFSLEARARAFIRAAVKEGFTEAQAAAMVNAVAAEESAAKDS